MKDVFLGDMLAVETLEIVEAGEDAGVPPIDEDMGEDVALLGALDAVDLMGDVGGVEIVVGQALGAPFLLLAFFEGELPAGGAEGVLAGPS